MDIFSKAGAEKRKEHGIERRAGLPRPAEEDRVSGLLRWTSRAGRASCRIPPSRSIMKEAGTSRSRRPRSSPADATPEPVRESRRKACYAAFLVAATPPNGAAWRPRVRLAVTARRRTMPEKPARGFSVVDGAGAAADDGPAAPPRNLGRESVDTPGEVRTLCRPLASLISAGLRNGVLEALCPGGGWCAWASLPMRSRV